MKEIDSTINSLGARCPRGISPALSLSQLPVWFFLGLLLPGLGADPRPDIRLIAVDDLTDWISPLGVHPQSLTPNFERLARQSVVFGNAHCLATAEDAVITSRAVFTRLVESADGKATGHFIVPETGARIRID